MNVPFGTVGVLEEGSSRGWEVDWAWVARVGWDGGGGRFGPMAAVVGSARRRLWNSASSEIDPKMCPPVGLTVGRVPLTFAHGDGGGSGVRHGRRAGRAGGAERRMEKGHQVMGVRGGRMGPK